MGSYLGRDPSEKERGESEPEANITLHSGMCNIQTGMCKSLGKSGGIAVTCLQICYSNGTTVLLPFPDEGQDRR